MPNFSPSPDSGTKAHKHQGANCCAVGFKIEYARSREKGCAQSAKENLACPGVKVTVGNVSVPVLFSGAQGDFVGLDQINLELPQTLAGKGEVDINLTAEGKKANAVKISIK